MTMITVKTADLIGPALDWVTLYAANPHIRSWDWDVRDWLGYPCPVFISPTKPGLDNVGGSPSREWACGGPLIEEHKVWLGAPYGNRHCWNASYHISVDHEDGDTPLIAACRAIVASTLGDVVQVPAELVP